MDNEEVNIDIIERLMKEDKTFMHRINIIKGKLETNLKKYADSINTATNGFDLQDSLNDTTDKFSNVSGIYLAYQEN